MTPNAEIASMDMLEKHIKDLLTAITYCYTHELLMPCLVLLYSGIDVAASLEASLGQGVRERFEKWVERYMLNNGSLPCTATELYAARCAVVHTFTPDSDISRAGKARVVAYAYGIASLEKLDKATVLTQRQALQANVHLKDLIEAFRSGFESYLKEAFADGTRWREVIQNASNWTVSIDPNKVEQFVELSSSSAPANPKEPSS